MLARVSALGDRENRFPHRSAEMGKLKGKLPHVHRTGDLCRLVFSLVIQSTRFIKLRRVLLFCVVDYVESHHLR